MHEDPSALPPGTILAGRFRVMRCLGQGGMGSVYEIEHELTKHRRALKLLHASMTALPGVVERFLREASAAGRVGNPHIVETFDAGKLDTGEPYLVMEMLRGETLSDRIAQGPMSVQSAVDLVGQACEGIQAAHDAGIVHRDLKPDNLFITDVDGAPFVKILDFGISKFDPSKTGGMALTQEGAALGTPYYMSPEQIRGEKSLDARSDVYALGVILYECLAGQRPFEADALTQLAVLIHTGTAKPLAEHRPDLPPALVELVSHAMCSDRTRRMATARELREGLERFGSISFRTRVGAGSSPDTRAPRSAVAAHSMATSAAGVSVRGAAMPAPKSQLAPILIGFGVLGVVGVTALLIARGGASPGPEVPVSGAKATGVATAAPTAAPPPVSTAPVTSVATALPPSSAAAPPAPSAAAAPRPPASANGKLPVVAPMLPPQPTSAPAAAPAPAPAPASPAPPKPRRTEEKGLAKDNPFR